MKDFYDTDWTKEDRFVPGATSRYKPIPREQRLAARAQALADFQARDFSGSNVTDIGKAYGRAVRAGGGGRESNYDPLGNRMLGQLVLNRKHGIRFNPRLAAFPTANTWLNERQARYPEQYGGWDVQTGDFDNDPETIDNVIIRDAQGRWRIVDGYSLDAGTKKRLRQAIFTEYPNAIDRKGFLQGSDKFALKMAKKYLNLSKTKRDQFGNFDNYVTNFISTHPNTLKQSPYQQIRAMVANTLRNANVKDQLPHKKFYIPAMAKTVKAVYDSLKNGTVQMGDINQDEIVNLFGQKYTQSAAGYTAPIPQQRAIFKNNPAWISS
jgi:hypothetical protein